MKDPEGWKVSLMALSQIIADIPIQERPKIDALAERIMDVMGDANVQGFRNYEIVAAWLATSQCMCMSMAAQSGEREDVLCYALGHAVQSYLEEAAGVSDGEIKEETAGRVH